MFGLSITNCRLSLPVCTTGGIRSKPGTSVRRDFPLPSLSAVSSESTVYFTAVPQWNRRQLSDISDRYPSGARQKTADLNRSFHHGYRHGIRIQWLPCLYESIQKSRRHYPFPISSWIYPHSGTSMMFLFSSLHFFKMENYSIPVCHFHSIFPMDPKLYCWYQIFLNTIRRQMYRFFKTDTSCCISCLSEYSGFL